MQFGRASIAAIPKARLERATFLQPLRSSVYEICHPRQRLSSHRTLSFSRSCTFEASTDIDLIHDLHFGWDTGSLDVLLASDFSQLVQEELAENSDVSVDNISVVAYQWGAITVARRIDPQKENIRDQLQKSVAAFMRSRSPREQRVAESGILASLENMNVLMYLKSKEAVQDLQALKSRVAAAMHRVKEAAEENLQNLGMPPSNYLDDTSNVIIPNVGEFVSKVSSLVTDAGFEVPAYFKADTLEEAVRQHIVRTGPGLHSYSMACALRDCLRLIGDALVFLDAVEPDTKVPQPGLQILPIVDTGLGSEREDMLQTLILQSFEKNPKLLRGGVLMGFKGFGKTQLLLNVVLCRQLIGWAYKGQAPMGSKIHIGMILENPTGGMQTTLTRAPPTAILAAGLHQQGLLQDPDLPNWAVPALGAFKAKDALQWLGTRQIDCTLVIDEAQEMLSSGPAKRTISDPHDYTAQERVFWDSVDDIVFTPSFPMMLLSGTASHLGDVVYERSAYSLQRSKMRPRFLEYKYTDIEMLLMMTRQLESSNKSLDSKWVPTFAISDDEPSLASVTAQVDVVHPEDVVLALALELSKVPKDLASSNTTWSDIGQMVYPSVEYVCSVVRLHEDAVTDSGEPLSSGSDTAQGHELAAGIGDCNPNQAQQTPSRLTFASAARALSDDSVRRAAYGSRARVQARLWQTGSLARSLLGINDRSSGETDLHDTLKQWRNCLSNNEDGFRDVTLAMLDELNELHPDWYKELEQNPFKAPPKVSVDAVHRRYKENMIREHREEVMLTEDGFLMKLSGWRNKQLIGYRTAAEVPRDPQENPIGVASLEFLSGFFAFLSHAVDVRRGIYLTRREFWAMMIPGHDYELVVAESLHRNFVSKVLQKDLLKSLPESVWKTDEFAVDHDRCNCFEGNYVAKVPAVSKIKAIKLPSQKNELLNKVLKEEPDRLGGDLTMIFKEDPEASQTDTVPKYHVVRIQVKSGYSPVNMADLKTFLGKNKSSMARRRYAALLDVDESQVVTHRLLATPRPLADDVERVFDRASRGDAPGGTAAGATKKTKTNPLVIDYDNLHLLTGDAFQQFLFADARVLDARMKARREAGRGGLPASTAAKKLEHDLRDELMPAGRIVDPSCLAERARWQ